MKVIVACKMLDALGFITQQVSFERVVNDQSFRETLTDRYRGSSTTDLLLHMPDILALHKTAEAQHAGLFITVLADDEELDVETWFAYRKYYPKQVALMRFSRDGATIQVTARWYHEHSDAERPLVQFLHDGGITSLPKDAFNKLRQMELEVT